IITHTVGAPAVHHCHSCGGVADIDAVSTGTPGRAAENCQFEHIANLTASFAPLPSKFHYPDYLYLQGLSASQLLVFPSNSAAAKACSSGSM
ncbi:hypothetical protein V1504DRAFT_365877, partial [Lipomyces starkeyi]